jgi:hypothetical protein
MESQTCRTKDKENMGNLRTNFPICKKIRTMGKQRKISGSGETSIRVPGIILLIVSQRSHWWLR